MSSFERRQHDRRRIILSGLVLLLAALAGSAFALSWHHSIPPIKPPIPQAFSLAEIARGAELAAVGDCAVCHTAADGRPFAGGRAVPTPFGTVYATNITPDPMTGIGAWSDNAFRRAMRDGIGRDGSHLYPVLPYPHFTRATDADIGALYAFLMTRTPVRATPPPNRLPFPLDQRVLLAGWNLLFLQPGAWAPDPTHDGTWNRGAYLVEAVGHCGACHTPHNRLGAERAQALAGGEAEDWYAPALQDGSPARVPWTEDSLTTYLRTGFEAGHGAAAGPMTAVTDGLGRVPEADVRAIAVYIAAMMPKSRRATERPLAEAPDTATAAMFQGACGSCHAADAPMTRGGVPSLSRSSSANAPTAQGVVQVILQGIPWREGRQGPYMPAFADSLTDVQVAALAAYVRALYGGGPGWPDIEARVATARKGGGA